VSGRVVVLGGSGFLGSHLCDQLLARDDEVVCVDNFSTGRRANVAHLADHAGFALVEADISAGIPVDGSVSGVFWQWGARAPATAWNSPTATAPGS